MTYFSESVFSFPNDYYYYYVLSDFLFYLPPIPAEWLKRRYMWGNAGCLCSCQLQAIGGSFLKCCIEMISEHLSAPSWKENYDLFMTSTMVCVLVCIHSLFLTQIFHTYYNHAGNIITINSLILEHILIIQLVLESRYIFIESSIAHYAKWLFSWRPEDFMGYWGGWHLSLKEEKGIP